MVRGLGDRMDSFFNKQPATDVAEDDAILREYCEVCSIALIDADVYLRFRVCPSCRFHYPIAAREHISLLAEAGSFKETNKSVALQDLSTSPKRVYRRNHKDTGLTEAAITGTGVIGRTNCVLIALDFRFSGGTMGSIAGEKISSGLELAAKKQIPVVALVTGGGLGVQNGISSLMQMAKTAFAFNQLKDKQIPLIVLMSNPTTGQAYSSFANLADIILAEPGAIIGVAPPSSAFSTRDNVSGYTAEAQFAHGMIDRVVDREHLQNLLSVLLQLLTPGEHSNAMSRKRRDVIADSAIKENYLEELWPQDWEAVPITRHNKRPTSLDLIRRTFESFVELHGDRFCADDPSIVIGLGQIGNKSFGIIGQEKGHDVTSKERHSGRTLPEGFYKAQRMMSLAAKFGLPLINFIDTPGPYYGRESEERGLGVSIASTMALMAQLPTRTISVIIGEGGSEGAFALGVSDRTLILEKAGITVTSPENAAALLYNDYVKGQKPTEVMQLSPQDCYELGVIDLIIPEPPRGAQSNPDAMGLILKDTLQSEIESLSKYSIGRIAKARYRKFRRIGQDSSRFRTSFAQEAAYLQSYMAHTVRRIKRRRNRRRSLSSESKQD